MRKILFTAVLFLNSATAFADFDWSKYAYEVKNTGKSVQVSRLKFEQRYYAAEFCKKLNLKLADFETIKKLSVYSEPKLKEIIFKADTNRGKISGIWAWQSTSVVKTADDFTMMKFDDEAEGEQGQFSATNRWLMTNGMTPYKGLPAICE